MFVCCGLLPIFFVFKYQWESKKYHFYQSIRSIDIGWIFGQSECWLLSAYFSVDIEYLVSENNIKLY